MEARAYNVHPIANNYPPRSRGMIPIPLLNRIPKVTSVKKTHALIGVSPFNGYFSATNMEILFQWAKDNFSSFSIFTMDKASKYNLMAMGYEEQQAIKKTQKQDQHLYNKVIRCLKNIGFSEDESKEKILLISHLESNERYLKLYKECLELFENNNSFRFDCLNASKCVLAAKAEEVTDESLRVAVNYLLEELPIWLNTPYILGIQSSTFVYKDLPLYWRNICYNYGLISQQQEILIKNIDSN